MKVETETKPKHVIFAEITPASCFFFGQYAELGTHENRMIWMRLSGTKNDHAVNLSTGALVRFDSDVACIPVDMNAVPV